MIDALNQIGLKADRPETAEGKKKAVGYPDIVCPIFYIISKPIWSRLI